ncbi:MAG: amidohydrolase family protein [Alphaproteobacteria bacterium]|nr:amidohydrolase family protein [Alphaproteobacteria bacterium]
MSARTAYVNARLIDPAGGRDETGALLVADGRIADLGARLFADGVPDGIETVDCGAMVLAPGLVDARVLVHEPGETYKESVASAAAAAVTGGVTTMVTLPNTNPVIDDVSLIEFMITRGEETGLVNVHPYGALTVGARGERLTEIGLLREAGAVAFTDGVHAVGDAVLMRRALSYATAFDALIIQHPEEPSLARGGQMNEGEIATRLGLQGVPACAEVMMIERDLHLVRLTGGRYHAAHVSTAAGVDAIRQARARGLAITCDTAPHYFGLNEAEIGSYRTFAKLSPPLRSEDDRKAVAEGLRDGTIDLIASDHIPQDPDSKRLPFAQAIPGATGLETLLPLVLELYHNRVLTLIDAIGKVTAAPAALLGLDAGRLTVGARADLVLIDPDRPWKIREGDLLSKSKNTLFDGRPVQGRCVRTVFGGRTVFAGEA